MTDFDRVITQIIDIFSQLIEQLNDKRDKLLEEVFQIRDDFDSKELTRVKSLENIEKVELQIQEVSLKENFNRSLHEQVELMYQQDKQKKYVPSTPPDLSFNCPTLFLLQSQISQFGEVQQNSTQDQKNIFIHEGYSAQDSETITIGAQNIPKFKAPDSQLTNQKGYKNKSRESAECLTTKNIFSKSTHSIPRELNFYLSSDDFDQNNARNTSCLKSPRSQPELNLEEYFIISLRDFKQNCSVTRDGIADSFARPVHRIRNLDSKPMSEFPFGEQVQTVTADDKGKIPHPDCNVEYVEKRRDRAAKKELRSSPNTQTM